eukprot:5966640-Amphidinium_carterae.1
MNLIENLTKTAHAWKIWYNTSERKLNTWQGESRSRTLVCGAVDMPTSSNLSRSAALRTLWLTQRGPPSST